MRSLFAARHGFSHALGLHSKASLAPDDVTPLVKSQKCRHKDNRHEARHGTSPVNTERVVHGGGEKGESGGRSRTDDGGGGERGGGVAEVGVDNVVGQAHVEQDHAETSEDTCADGDEPKGGWVVGPGEPEETNGEADRAQHGGRKTSLGGCFAVAPLDNLGVAALVIESRVEEGEDNTECHGQEGKRGIALGPAAGLLKDDGVGCEQQEHSTLHNREEGSEESNNGLQEEQQEGAECADLELAHNSLLLAHTVDEMDLAEDSGHLGCATTEEGGSKSLGEGEEHGQESRAGERCNEDSQRAPAEIAV